MHTLDKEDKEKLLTIKEVAEYLQLDEHTIYKIAKKEEMPAYKFAGNESLRKSLLKALWQERHKRDIEGGKRCYLAN